MLTPYEPPVAIHPTVGVVVPDGLVDPTIAVLDLGLAVDVAGGVVGPGQVDLVGSDVQHRHADRPELRVETLPQGSVSPGALPGAHVGHEQGHQGLEIALVQGDGVAGDQLPDVGLGHQAFQVGHSCGGGHVAGPFRRLSAQPPGVVPSMRTRREANLQWPSTGR